MDRRTLDFLAIAGDLDLDRVLQRILRTARSAVGARYGALGIPDGQGGFARFLTVGISARRQSEIGDLPRVHGVLGALLDAGPIRLADIRQHPQFGWYPAHHPVLKDFLGVPIEHRGEVLGNLFLAGSSKHAFSSADQRAVETLAAYAGVAIANARLHRQAQELATMEERARVARELHDAATQQLFSLVYEARAAALRTEDAEAREGFRRLEERANAALGEMRSLIQALRPGSLERDGLEATLRDHVEALRHAHGAAIELRASGEPRLSPDEGLALLRIAQEALHNALRHAPGARIRVTVEAVNGRVLLSVRDWGLGFDPGASLAGMGLRSMRERAASVGAGLRIDSAPGQGTEVAAELHA